MALRTRAGCEVIAVIKADAYGHGLVPVARALVHRGSAECLAVATLEEAIEIRKKLSEVEILVLSSFFPHQIEAYLKHRVSVMVHSLTSLKSLMGQTRLPALHLKIDTGMNRLGIKCDEVSEAAKVLSRLPEKLAGLATHFAESERVSSRFTLEQIERFEGARSQLAKWIASDARIHLANSGGILRGTLGPATAVRAGLSLFGLLPLPTEDSADMSAVLEWKTRVLSLKVVNAGESIGYGRSYPATQKRQVAILPVGYADGLPRRMTNVGDVLIFGKRARIVGVISMDLTAVDVTNIPGVREGTTVTIIGTQGTETISAWEIARHSQTIAYEVLCGISSRVPRLYYE